jgi:hypothetical protein
VTVQQLSAPILKYCHVFAVVFFHRRAAEGAESDYLLFTAERPVNKKIQALQAKRKTDQRVDLFHNYYELLFALIFINCRCIFCRRLIVFHLPSSQRQMKRNFSLRSLRLCGEINEFYLYDEVIWLLKHQ